MNYEEKSTSQFLLNKHPKTTWISSRDFTVAATMVSVLAMVGFLHAQSRSAPASSFDVVSIKISKTPGNGPSADISGNTFTSKSNLKKLISWAYNIPVAYVVGGPPWISDTDYEITGKGKGNNALGPRDARLMVQTALADRFRFQGHREQRATPVYGLAIAKGGPKLREATPASTPSQHTDANGGSMVFTGTSVSMGMFAGALSSMSGRRVVDMTGLKGEYDINFEWNPGPEGRSGMDASSEAKLGPSLFTALQRKLGLQLTDQKTNLEYFVIDRVERPSPN